MTQQPETLTPREFAARLGFKPHYGNQLAKDGRLVFAPDGKRVLVQESIARFNATKDPSRQGVADRHAAGRADPPAVGEAPDGEDAEDGQSGDVPLYSFQNAKAKREHWAAEREHAAFRKEAGELIELTTHIAAMADVGATVRAKLEAWASTLPPQLAGRDEAAVRATLADQVELLLRDLADRVRRHSGEGQGAA
jgi:hypothetical protein